MTERNGYQPGVPSWVDNLAREPKRLAEFYAGLFGWDFSEPGEMPGDPPGEYFVASLRGREVAGVGSLPEAQGVEPAWNTYVEVEDVERTARETEAAGGSILVEPFDASPAGRIAVVADPGGAPFAIRAPDARRGAELVNEPGA